MAKVSKGPIAGLAPIPITTCKVRVHRLNRSQHFIDFDSLIRVVEVASFEKEKVKLSYNYTVSASIVDPSASLTAVTRPSEPASKLFMEAPCSTVRGTLSLLTVFLKFLGLQESKGVSLRH